MPVDRYEERIRQQRINSKLRAIGRAHALLIDACYMSGLIDMTRWNAVHLFREDRLAFLAAKPRKQLPTDARPRKPQGFSMGFIKLERAETAQRLMTVECFDDALVLIGEREGELEESQITRAVWEIWQVYAWDFGRERWKDGPTG